MMKYKSIAKTALRKMGLAIYRIPTERQSVSSGYNYAVSYPNATLAPWLGDRVFMQTYERVKHNTLVDIYRMYELWELAGQALQAGGDIVEVGVWRGGTGCLMAKRAETMNASSRVFLCDTFSGVVKAGAEDSSYKGGEHSDTGVTVLRKLEADLSLDNTEVLVGVFPDTTGNLLATKNICLCHIDVDVYQSAKDAVEFVWDRIPAGGVIVFDDYGFAGCEGVTRYVDELRTRDDVFFFNNLNGHAVILKQGVLHGDVC